MGPGLSGAFDQLDSRIGLDAGPGLVSTRWPDNAYSIDLRIATKTKMHANVAGRQIAAIGMRAAPDAVTVGSQ